jgi:membrane protein YdbS with pleckstrin-like domain
MALNQPTSTVNTNQISTTDLAAGPSAAAPPTADELYGGQGPDPKGTTPQAERRIEQEDAANRDQGIEGEQVVWEARYSMRNFIGRITLRTLLTIAWIALAVYTWGYGHESIATLTIIAGVAVLLAWLQLIYRIVQARFSHYYRLTNKRLFVSSGLMHRRRDQMELLHVKDVFTRQSLVQRWLSIGTVVVTSKEAGLETCYLPGVDDPKRVMDLIWHCARAERDGRSIQVADL